jgi:hypothetical protein
VQAHGRRGAALSVEGLQGDRGEEFGELAELAAGARDTALAVDGVAPGDGNVVRAVVEARLRFGAAPGRVANTEAEGGS